MEDINHIISEVEQLSCQKRKIEEQIEQKKTMAKEYFDRTGNTSVEYGNCRIYVDETTLVKYNLDAIKKRLGVRVWRQFIDDVHLIDNWNPFLEFCKSRGIHYKELLPFITTKSSVNNEKLSKLYKKGSILLSDLDGCYTASTTKSIAVLTREKENENV